MHVKMPSLTVSTNINLNHIDISDILSALISTVSQIMERPQSGVTWALTLMQGVTRALVEMQGMTWALAWMQGCDTGIG
ncbi:hypothetical protein Lal_00032570 [Lupinus albus]|nr:hypothetical protein Lal_00032570 [Lupinus albus]